MTKYAMASYIVNSRGWDGTKSITKLVKENSKEELKDMYEMAQDYENGMEYMN